MNYAVRALALSLFLFAVSHTAASAQTDNGLFAPDSFWKTPLAHNAKVDPLSKTYVADLRSQVATYGTWINSREHSTPVYTVGPDQPTVRVQLDNVQSLLQAAWEAVPIPENAVPAAGTDRTLTIYQPSTDTLWEFWLASKQLDGWHARYGGRMDNVSKNPGYFPLPNAWGATATSLPAIGGLMRINEWQAGRFDHGLAIAIPNSRAKAWSWPAQRTDGRVADTKAIPQGTRFRIDPKVDLSRIPMPWATRIMAEAVQKYGMVVRDTAGSVAFYAEDPTPLGGTNPYVGFYGGKMPSQLLASFPWDKLVALQTQMTIRTW